MDSQFLTEDLHTVLISPKLTNIFFCTEVFLQSFSLLSVWLCNFLLKEIGTKSVHKMLVKLTRGEQKRFYFQGLIKKCDNFCHFSARI